MREKTDDAPGILAPPPLIYLGLIGGGVILDSFWPLPLPSLPLGPALGISVLAAGFLLSAWSVLEFVRHKTHPDPYRPTSQIVTSGPFRFSRNPIYVAFALIHLGVGLWWGNGWIVMMLVPAVGVIWYGVVRPEERYLERKFGETYLLYKRSVRRWI